MKTSVLSGIDLSPYLGEWVVITGDKVIAHSSDLTKLRKDINNCKSAPLIAKIPKEDTLIFYGNNI